MPVVAGSKARRLVAEREVLDVVLREGFPDGRREGGGGHRSVASMASGTSRRRVSCRVDAYSCRPCKGVQRRDAFACGAAVRVDATAVGCKGCKRERCALACRRSRSRQPLVQRHTAVASNAPKRVKRSYGAVPQEFRELDFWAKARVLSILEPRSLLET